VTSDGDGTAVRARVPLGVREESYPLRAGA
jgi:hypothetical protein